MPPKKKRLSNKPEKKLMAIQKILYKYIHC